MYKLKLTQEAQADYDWLEKCKGKNSPLMSRLNRLLRELQEHPKVGIGKPEPLKGNLSGLWSRRIDEKHRLVYEIQDSKAVVFAISMRDHYTKL